MTDVFNAPHEQAAADARALHRGRPDDPAAYGVGGCCYRTFWAVVETDGRFVCGRNVARVARLAEASTKSFSPAT
jgi:hypothetical protein